MAITFMDNTDKEQLQKEIVAIDKKGGVYIGSGIMPEGYNIQINPYGDVNENWDDILESLSSAPEFVDTIEEMVDDTKVYVLKSTGEIWVNKKEEIVTSPNLFDSSKTTLNRRFSGDSTVAANGAFISNPIPINLSTSETIAITVKGLPNDWRREWISASQKVRFMDINQTKLVDNYIQITTDETKMLGINAFYCIENNDASKTFRLTNSVLETFGLSETAYLQFCLGMNEGSVSITADDIAGVEICIDTNEKVELVNMPSSTGLYYASTVDHSLNPEFANDISECTDIKRLYVLPDGYIYAYMETTEYTEGSTNVIAESIDIDGSVYNGGLGYKNGYRINSSGAEVAYTANDTTFTTGFIPIAGGDTVRFNGNYILSTHVSQGSFNAALYDPNFVMIVATNMSGLLEKFLTSDSIIKNDEGYLVEGTFTTDSYFKTKDVAYIRFTMLGTGEDAIITVNEEITEGATETSYKWTNTGFTFGTATIPVVASVEDMTDTAKKYILADTGTIWAYYNTSKYVEGSTNVIVESIDNNGSIYNGGLGYMNGYRINSSGEAVTTAIGAFVTGFIPIEKGDNIRVNGNYFLRTHENQGSLNIGLYDSDFTKIATQNINGAFTGTGMFNDVVDNDEGYSVQGTLNPNWSSIVNADVAYIRFSMLGSGEDAIITINEEITEGFIEKTYGWHDTNIIYNGSDINTLTSLNERVTDNEKNIATLFDKIDSLELEQPSISESNNESELVPNYWKDAVDNLSNAIETYQSNAGSKAFQFIWFADLHGVNGMNNAGYSQPTAGTSSVKNIGYASQYAAEKFDIPFIAIAGDIHSQSSHTSVDSVYDEYEKLRTLLSPIDRDKLIYTKGNHDGAWGGAVDGVYYLNNIGGNNIYNQIYRRQSLERERVFGGDGSYFYVDSPQKVRFIMLNCHTDGDGSNDANGHAVYNSMKTSVYGTEQLAWLANTALDLPDGYSAIVMAHQPISASKDGILLAGILNAYNNKTTYNGTVEVSGTYWGNGVEDTTYKISAAHVNFSDVDDGEVIAFFNGHVHTDSINASTYTFPCISITTAGADVRDANPVTRVPGTATETAMDIVTIDMKNRMIYCTRLGAGHDREISY